MNASHALALPTCRSSGTYSVSNAACETTSASRTQSETERTKTWRTRSRAGDEVRLREVADPRSKRTGVLVVKYGWSSGSEVRSQSSHYEDEVDRTGSTS